MGSLNNLKPKSKPPPFPVDHRLHNDRLRAATGKVTSTDPMVAFLYELMRDHLPLGKVEELVRNSPKMEYVFTNGFLANYAKDLAERLK